MRVSIITVCYNSEKTIRRTIESVYRQTYQNIEYIIVDGKSSDRTLQIIDEYKPLFGERMRVITEPDNGIYDAMNKGISLATGSVIGIINSDDYYEENAVETVINHMTDEKYQFLYGMLRFMRVDKVNFVSLVMHDFLEERPINHPSCFITKSVYEDFGYYNLQYKYVSDYEFCLRLKKNEKIQFVPIYEILANFTEGGASSTYESDIELLKLKKSNNLISRSQFVILYGRRIIGRILGF